MRRVGWWPTTGSSATKRPAAVAYARSSSPPESSLMCSMPTVSEARRGLPTSYQRALAATDDAPAADERPTFDGRPDKERGVPGFLVSPAEKRVILIKRALLSRMYSMVRRCRSQQ